jgi:hypothetical protein
MLPSRGAQTRRWQPGRKPILLSGRAHFVWLHGVLVPIACGLAPDGVEIRRQSPFGPWHLIRMTPEEALAEIDAGYPLTRAGLRRKIAAVRRSLAAKAVGEQGRRFRDRPAG